MAGQRSGSKKCLLSKSFNVLYGAHAPFDSFNSTHQREEMNGFLRHADKLDDKRPIQNEPLPNHGQTWHASDKDSLYGLTPGNGTGHPRTKEEQKSPSVRVLLLTAMTIDHIEKYQQVTNAKQCYVLKHGYTFILETNSAMAKNINPWWFKVYAIQKYLPYFDWVVWLDGDCLILNHDVKFEWFLDDPNADLVMTDHNFAVNNGVFALRNTVWSAAFLVKWLGAGQMVHAGGARWWQDDQGAMFHLLVAQGNTSYDGHCALRQNCCSDIIEQCFREGMKAGGHFYLERRVPKVRFISPKAHHVVATGTSIRGVYID